jgi:hypothetical protein
MDATHHKDDASTPCSLEKEGKIEGHANVSTHVFGFMGRACDHLPLLIAFPSPFMSSSSRSMAKLATYMMPGATHPQEQHRNTLHTAGLCFRPRPDAPLACSATTLCAMSLSSFPSEWLQPPPLSSPPEVFVLLLRFTFFSPSHFRRTMCRKAAHAISWCQCGQSRLDMHIVAVTARFCSD